MAYELLQNGNTQFAIDWSVVRRLLHASWTARLQHWYSENAQVTTSERQWYNPLSWSMPDIVSIDVDWDAVRKESDKNTELDLQELRAEAARDAGRVGRVMERRVIDGIHFKEAYLKDLRDVSYRNMRALESSSSEYASTIAALKKTRDFSAGMLTVMAGVMVSAEAGVVIGAETAVVVSADAIKGMAAGSILQGFAKYEDTGSIGTSLMTASGTFTFGLIKVGSVGKEVALAFVKAGWGVSTDLVGGDTVGEAISDGVVTLASPALNRIGKIVKVRDLIKKMSLPIAITRNGENIVPAVAEKGVGYGMKLAARAGVRAVSQHMQSTSGKEQQTGRMERKRSGRIVNQSTLSDLFLLKLAYVNMEKGIGRGW